MKAKYIPNILSTIRLLLVGAFIYAYYNIGAIYALIIFIVAGATDVVDGILARRFDWITNVGKILDPIADKSMQCTVLLCMSTGDEPLIPWWFAAFFIVKEVLMALGALFLFKKKDTVVSSKWFGKLAVCIFYAAVFLIIALDPSDTIVITLAVITILAAAISFASYTYNYFKKPTQAANHKSLTDSVSN